jgi:hypothetical protein
MRQKTGKEMRRLMVAISATTLLLVLGIIAYFLVDIIVTTNQNIEHNKEKMIEESVRSLQDVGKIANFSTINPEVISLFNPELVERGLSGDTDFLYDIAVKIARSFYPVDYVSFISNGKIESYEADDDYDINPEDMPTQPPQGEYETLDTFGGKSGFFVSVFNTINMGITGLDENTYSNLIVDRTQELREIEEYFTSQRNDLILELCIGAAIAILLTLLLTTFGLRYFTRKYVVKPIEDLNRTAEEIASGTFEGELHVDEGSAYAALQGLLRSGQKVLSRMDEEMGE